MRKKSKKKSREDRIKVAFIIAAIVVIVLGFFMLKKPSITGFAVITKETTFSDNLNLVVNESKNIAWNLRNPGSLKSLKASGAISRNGTAKVYIQKDSEKVLIFDSTKQLFDVNVEVLPDYKRIFQGDELLIQIILFNLRGFGSADVNVKYSIKDTKGNLMAAQEETITVETQAKFIRKLLIPPDLKPGTYVTFVEVETPDDLIGTSSDLFEVTVKYEEKYPLQLRYYILGLSGMVILIIIIIFAAYLFKKIKRKKRVTELKEKMPEEKRQKLEKELKALESAYNSKFISEQSYKKGRERIEKILWGLKGGQLKKKPKSLKKNQRKNQKSLWKAQKRLQKRLLRK